ncbi:MAG TPA: hypothetical protein VF510_04575 [Ktedonobacterales bacterium]
MDKVTGLDWGGYFHDLSDDDIRELASWLAAECIEVWEFMDIVDRAYVQTAEAQRERSLAFVRSHGRPVVAGYARRKRRFAELTATLDEACLRGALPGEVAPEELQPLRVPETRHHSAEDLLGVLERTRGGAQ